MSSALTSSVSCSRLTVTRGSIGSGQSKDALAVQDQSGTEDDWERYLEFSPAAQVVCAFPVSGPDVSELEVRVNYRGPTRSAMRWTFQAWDFASSTWIQVGDNAFAPDWSWAARDLALPAPLGRFVSWGEVRVRYATDSTADYSQLDHWALQVTTSDTSSDVWAPAPGTTWQWQLNGAIDTSHNVQMYDIDLFDAPQSTIDALRNAGRAVICYFSAGSYEEWRPDAEDFPESALGEPLDDWPGERWIDTRNATVRSVMRARLDLAVAKGCDGVEPDNVDGYTNDTGFPLTASTQLSYNRFLAAEAHARGLSVGLKNDVDQISDLVDDFDWALNEECGRYDECDSYQPFIDQGKAVFHTEYVEYWGQSCPTGFSKPDGFSSLLKRLDLDSWRKACP